ncbi:MAG TPA: LuxR C-terminal-related transcriptional regulator [Actinomycetota bacterium]|nr:LuxR C-terminal-related transcriptional regulator [Actinomycetota bacterium]
MGEAELVLEAARDAYRRRDWAGARERFAAARALGGELAAGDLDALADAAWWLGDVEEASAVLEEAYRRHLDEGRPGPAAMAAIGIGVNHLLRGDGVVGSGWVARAQRALRDQPERAEHGYVLYLELEGALGGDDPAAVAATARRVRDIGRRHADPNLVAAGDLFEGRALVRQGRMADGMAMLDEAMLAVLSGELGPEWAGNIYCHLMAAFAELGDVRRAAEWTEATGRWLAGLPAAVLFTGVCRVHRSQVLQRKGEWAQAEREADLVCRDLAGLHVAGAAEGHYQLGELRRLRGDLDGAEEAYRHAHRLGRDPQPGLALLRLAQGRAATAAASIRAALTAVTADRLARAWLCAAQVEIALAAGDPTTAGRACDELQRTASTYGSSGLEAGALQARGAVLLAGGRPDAALPTLRAACRRWQELDAPYDAARVRLLLARSYQALGDADAAGRELEEAGAVFERLGAGPDAGRVAALRGRPLLPGGLTGREAEVLALVAAGRTNREIAASLVLSHKTVARHLSNIFAKLEVSSRTQAAAYAFEHGLATPERG